MTPSGWPGLAVECGLYPIFEAEHGKVTQVRKIRRRFRCRTI